MSRFYVIWSDYDGANVEEFESKIGAEELIVNLLSSEQEDPYGINIIAVIKGVKLKYSPVEYISKIEIETS